MQWISIKDRLPPCDGNRELPFVLAYHSINGVGVAWFWKYENDGIDEELEEEFQDKYLCSCQFIKNMVDHNFLIEDEDDIDIFVHSPHFSNLGTVTHWMPIPTPPDENLVPIGVN